MNDEYLTPEKTSTSLISLPPLPDSMEEVNCNGCTSLSSVPEIPENVIFTCEGCPGYP